MSGHDATSIVAQAAGLDTGPRPERMTPEQLVAQFCSSILDGDGTTTAKGFCGFDGRSGYDDGYSFMGYLLDRGWRELPAKGDWPYLVYLAWPVRDGGRCAIAEYCEGDLTVWTFETPAAAKKHYAGLRDLP